MHFLPPAGDRGVVAFASLLQQLFGFDVLAARAMTVFALLAGKLRRLGKRFKAGFKLHDFMRIPARDMTRQALGIELPVNPFTLMFVMTRSRFQVVKCLG